MQAILPYQKTALFYDYLLNHVNYSSWASYIDKMVKNKISNKSLLDIACGTGSFLREMLKLGYQSAGVELSPIMVEQAKLKNPNIKIDTADMLTFKSDSVFSIITCLFDSVNYLETIDQITELCNHVFESLDPNGLFIFDSVTESHCLTHYFDYSEYDQYQKIEYERRCQFDIQNKIQRSTFIMKDGSEEFIEVHNQYIYKHQSIVKAIQQSKLNFEAAYADFTFDQVSKNSERIHYLCRKSV